MRAASPFDTRHARSIILDGGPQIFAQIKIKKRDGRIVSWDTARIIEAVKKALTATGFDHGSAEKIAFETADKTLHRLEAGGFQNGIPSWRKCRTP